MSVEDAKAWHSKLCDMREHEIVKLMEDEEIKARPNVSNMCAVSLLIRKKTGVSQVDTGYWGIYIESERGIEHSDALSDFISDFDAGKYPNLVAENG